MSGLVGIERSCLVVLPAGLTEQPLSDIEVCRSDILSPRLTLTISRLQVLDTLALLLDLLSVTCDTLGLNPRLCALD